MKKPSSKWLYVGIISVLCITVVGIVVTAYSYHATQEHAEKMGKEQLTAINDSAIKILTLEIESSKLSLQNFASCEENEHPAIENIHRSDLIQYLVDENAAAVGVYQVTTDNQLTAGWQFEKGQPIPELQLPAFVQEDPLYQRALQGGIPQNGETYFDDKHSYLNLYYPFYDKNHQLQSLLILPLDLEKLYRNSIDDKDELNGYTMVKNQDMKVIMHPSAEQIDLSIVESRRELAPELDYSDLERLEKEQLSHEKGTMSYYSYWWTEENPQKVLKLGAYEWISIGNARMIVASSSDFYERNGLVLQESLIMLGLLAILFAVIVLLVIYLHIHSRRNQEYLENIRLRERQQAMQERHAIETAMLKESKLETIGLLTTTIVHDMNNFLTPIIGNLQLLIEEHQDNELLVADLMEVYQAAEQGKKLSSNVLRFSKVNSSQKSLLSIDDVVQEALDTLRLLIPKKVTLNADIQSDGQGCFEKDDLQVILYNLVTNAYQSRDQGAIIDVRAKLADKQTKKKFQHQSIAYQDKDFVLIEIKDNGPGIPKEIEDKIFTPFFTTKTADGGTGLGLFTVSSIIKKNDWLLEVDSDENGTIFSIGIPLVNE